MQGILAGSKRYAHIAGVRGDGVAAQALGLKGVVSEDSVRRALKAMKPEASRGGQAIYSDLAVKAGLMLGLVFHLLLLQTEGLMASLFALLGVALSVPYRSTLSRRAMNLASVSKGCRLFAGPVHLLIDSKGLKVYGAGEWLQEKRTVRGRGALGASCIWRWMATPGVGFPSSRHL